VLVVKGGGVMWCHRFGQQCSGSKCWLTLVNRVLWQLTHLAMHHACIIPQKCFLIWCQLEGWGQKNRFTYGNENPFQCINYSDQFKGTMKRSPYSRKWLVSICYTSLFSIINQIKAGLKKNYQKLCSWRKNYITN